MERKFVHDIVESCETVNMSNRHWEYHKAEASSTLAALPTTPSDSYTGFWLEEMNRGNNETNLSWQQLSTVKEEDSIVDVRGDVDGAFRTFENIESEGLVDLETMKKHSDHSLMERCLFCLGKAGGAVTSEVARESDNPEELEELEEMPRADESILNETLLDTLNKSWGYLQKRGKWNWQRDSHPQQAVFTQLPKMCQLCTENLVTIGELMRKLIVEVNALGRVIGASRSGGTRSWREENYERTLQTSCAADQSMNDTDIHESQIGSDEEAKHLNEDPLSVVHSSGQQHSEEMEFKSECSDEDKEIDDPNEVPDYKKEEHSSSSKSDDGEQYSEDDDEESSEEDDEESSEEDDEHSLEDDDELSSGNNNSVQDNKAESESVPIGGIPIKEVLAGLGKSPKEIQLSTFVVMFDSETRRKRIYRCIVDGCCDVFPITSWDFIKDHQREVHNITKCICMKTDFILCRICGSILPDKAASRSHKRHCKRLTSEEQDRIRERQEKIEMKGRRECEICKIPVFRKDSYEHARAHVGEEYLLKCPSLKECPYCFCTEEGLRRHLSRSKQCKNSTPDDVKDKYLNCKWTCDVCGMERARVEGLRTHLLRVHESPEKSFPCPLKDCQKRFSVRQSVVLHLPLHTGKNAIPAAGVSYQKCVMCQQDTKLEEMEEHLNNSHNIQAVLKCNQCPFLFASRENLVDHLHVHRFSVLSCDICGADGGGPTFSNYARLRKHYFLIHEIGTMLKCQNCSIECFSPQEFKKHSRKCGTLSLKRTDAGDETKEVVPRLTYPCNECDSKFKSKNTLTEHEIACHERDLLACHYCDKKFVTYKAKTDHQREHKGILRKEVPCEVPGCGRVFRWSTSLSLHMFSAHGKGIPHVCEHCGKIFYYKNQLKVHVLGVHMKVRPPRTHMCDVCGESFNSSTVLRIHTLIHTKERSHSCPICGQRFRTKGPLATHLKGHESKGSNFRPTGAMKHIRKRVEKKNK